MAKILLLLLCCLLLTSCTTYEVTCWQISDVNQTNVVIFNMKDYSINYKIRAENICQDRLNDIVVQIKQK